jgi:hypothetical protein
LSNKPTFESVPQLLCDVLKNQELLFTKLDRLTNDVEPNDLTPHLTRKETAQFFKVSLNCINDWSKKGILQPFKVGQRTYFKRSDLLQVMFNQKTT